MENILEKDGEVFYIPQFLSGNIADKYFDFLFYQTQWTQSPIKIFGKEIMQPRLTAWYADDQVDYGYSGIKLAPTPWNSGLLELKEMTELKAQTNFNSVLLNLYRDNQDSMGWHRDNEKELGNTPTIASLTLGEGRTFKLRHYYEKEMKHKMELGHGDLLIMQGQSQNFWEHSVPKQSKAIGARINLTFRNILN